MKGSLMSHGIPSGKTHTGPEGETKHSAATDNTDTLMLSSLVIWKTRLIWSKTVQLTTLPHIKPCGGKFPWQQPQGLQAAEIRGTWWKSAVIRTAQKKRKEKEGGKKCCMSQSWNTFCSNEHKEADGWKIVAPPLPKWQSASLASKEVSAIMSTLPKKKICIQGLQKQLGAISG